MMDIGNGRTIEYFSFKPSSVTRQLNPKLDDVPDLERYGAHLTHELEDGEVCRTTFFFEEGRKVPSDSLRQFVTPIVDEPLSTTVILCRCGAEGRITANQWDQIKASDQPHR